jgi:hypothetical protein
MKTVIVYFHLIATCIAVGSLLIKDLELLFLKGRPLFPREKTGLIHTAQVIFLSLCALWVSGLLLVVVGLLENPQYLANEKLWAKVTVVCLLTLNGVLLHFYSFPRVVSHQGLVGLSGSEQTLVMFSGAVSTSSWLFACFLGIARPLNFTVPYEQVMFGYGVFVLFALIVSSHMLVLLRKSATDIGIRTVPQV